MPTSYSSYTMQDVENILGLRDKSAKLFPIAIPPIEPSDFFKMHLTIGLEMPLGTEKAKSEFIVVPLLQELRQRNNKFFHFFSGYTFNIDVKKALKGRSDFILSADQGNKIIRAPIISIVEAKNDNLEDGIGQCVAQMYASKIFNDQKNTAVPAIYGAVTSGFDWLFLRLANEKYYEVDTVYYSLNNLPELLGVWQIIIDYYKPKS
jgi:hypothetical protein